MSAFPRALRRRSLSDRRTGALQPAALSAALLVALGLCTALPTHAACPVLPSSHQTGVSEDGATGSVESSVMTVVSPGIIPADPRHYVAYQIEMTRQVPVPAEHDLRVATYQTGLTRSAPGELLTELSTSRSAQARQVAETVQQVRPDVLLLSGIDVDEGREVTEVLRADYLSIGSENVSGIDYPYAYVAPVNTGVDTGADLDDDGMIGGPGDAYGYGDFPGQAGMMLLSRHPLQSDQARTFQDFKWKDMPESGLPSEEFSDLESSVLRLSSASHWDVPLEVDGRTIHLLASAPADPHTAPAGPQRNYDEVRFWADYINGAPYPVDDEGETGGLATGSDFVVLGSLGADPDSSAAAAPGTIDRLLDLPQVQDTEPTSRGTLLARTRQDTAVVRNDDGEKVTARVDYVLPSSTLTAAGSGVFWPAVSAPAPTSAGPTPLRSSLPDEPGVPAQGVTSTPTEHRLVWVDITPGS